MNKTALKTFATNARRELLKKVEARAMKIGITEDNIKKADIESSDAIFIDGRQLSKEEKIQRDRLIDRIGQIGFKRVMEEVAYTWFNRFTALRFMEVNDYLPTKVRVLSSANAGSTEPDMMKEALSLDLDLDKEYVYELKMNNNSEELFKYLIIKHCNDLNRYMPFMFERIDDFTEFLFPEGLLATDSFVRQMTDTDVIPEGNWKEIEVIGWLYQYYIAEEKDRVFKEKKKYKAEEIPFATQLFTPDWIVRYMVQNSLGRYWVESHPEHRDLLNDWELYLENDQEDFEDKIAPYVNKHLNVEDIKCFDPAMGSGHILVYAFDVFYEIYSKCGYMEREIPRFIIENNLYGLDIDDRAYQLACFSIVMKAMKYNRRFLRSIEREGLTLNLASIQETKGWSDEDIEYIVGESSGKNFNYVKDFIEQYANGKTFGSLIKVKNTDITFLEERLNIIKSKPVENLFQTEKRERILSTLPKLIKQTEIMGNKYEVVILNPPYMGSASMNKDLSEFLKSYYPDSKSDLFAAFMEIDNYINDNGFYAAINQHSWMFLSSLEKLRGKIIKTKFIDTMLHLGPRAFEEIGGEVVQSTTFVLRNTEHLKGNGIYLSLIDEATAIKKREKAIESIRLESVPYLYKSNQKDFTKIPGSPIAYWVSENVYQIFNNYESLYSYTTSASQNVTGNNNKFLRFHWEVDKDNIGRGNRWIFYAKGGGYRKWYGNLLDVVDWSLEARETYRTGHASQIIPEEYWYKKGITWGLITTVLPSFRVLPEDSTFDKGGSSIFVNNPKLYNYILGFLNSKVSIELMKCLNVTLNFQVRDVRNLPLIIEKQETVNELIEQVINLSKENWDSSETSWDFKKHPLVKCSSPDLESAFKHWEKLTESQFNQFKLIEEDINRIFIGLYGLQEEITPNIEDKEVSIHKSELERDIKSFISYAIGCSFGRYSLDEEGLIYAGGTFEKLRYKTFPVDQDNILSILPGSYFEDDIVSRFVDFVRTTFGLENLNKNLDFIAYALGRKKGETAKETLRRYFLNDFFKDHVQMYKKRPIYWLFTSGKEKAFNCLIYMHRYHKTTLSRIRTDYLHDYQIRLDAEKKDLLNIIEGDSTAKEISNAKKELKSLDKKIEELKAYDELLHHMADMQIEIDLDDGVKLNYEKFKGLVAKI
ncbi:BREX-1 system adenine-specific DNA-methyltransferase PglX [Paucisalibacillus sp. EB02]|uniref:BREX-1 system adenine-specific DNA-methyltransferase PglX n=1 Tax=Paucisalibacillus sp. EB02 TaxID=1347087 RepID=UPI0004B3B293|nr:BREX-1 system adenine-specific DNA-methyltransferase PglX [Paucisalibacillus sp. EB02]